MYIYIYITLLDRRRSEHSVELFSDSIFIEIIQNSYIRISMAEASNNLVSLESFDGEIFEVEEAVASQSGFMKSVTGNVGT